MNRPADRTWSARWSQAGASLQRYGVTITMANRCTTTADRARSLAQNLFAVRQGSYNLVLPTHSRVAPRQVFRQHQTSMHRAASERQTKHESFTSALSPSRNDEFRGRPRHSARIDGRATLLPMATQLSGCQTVVPKYERRGTSEVRLRSVPSFATDVD